MNPDIDDLVRDAVRRQEALAVDPERIRARLPARAARQHRTRRIATLAAIGVAAAAVAVPVIVLRDPDPGGSGPAASSTAAPTTGPAIPGLATGALKYRPTWLPDGMVERYRAVPLVSTPGPKDTTTRQWQSTSVDDEASGHIGLAYWPSVRSPADTAIPPVMTGEGGLSDRAPSHEVDINGNPGQYDTEVVTWQVDADTKLMLYAPGTGLSEDVMLRIARSVVPDTTALRAPLRVDWLPDGIAGEFLDVSGDSPSQWSARIFADGERGYVSTSVGTRAPAASGEQLPLAGGRTANLAQVDEEDSARGYRTRWVLTVDLGNGRYLTVLGGDVPGGPVNALSREDMVRVAENVVLDPSPDLTWLGR